MYWILNGMWPSLLTYASYNHGKDSIKLSWYNGGDSQSTKNSLGQLHVVSLFVMFDQTATHLHLGESEILRNLNLE